MDVEAVSSSALDVAALRRLAEASRSARLVALSNLHAKVFVADEKAAIVTSGNLTRAGLDYNFELGVLLREQGIVRAVRQEVLSFVRLGSEVGVGIIADLAPLEVELRQARVDLIRNTNSAARRRFTEVMRQAKPVLASTQIGNRSAHAVFGEAIQLILERGSQPTRIIEEQVRQLLPVLCDDNDYFYIRGERYGKAWKRRLRHAQLHLKRRGILSYDTRSKVWALTHATSIDSQYT